MTIHKKKTSVDKHLWLKHLNTQFNFSLGFRKTLFRIVYTFVLDYMSCGYLGLFSLPPSLFLKAKRVVIYNTK